MVEVYGLHHARLNVEVPPRSMWQNLGYWKEDDVSLTTAQKFESACKSFLDELLTSSGMLQSNDPSEVSTLSEGEQLNRLKIIDLGTGCGDQSLRIREHWTSPARYKFNASSLTYLGITRNKIQWQFAQSRLKALGVSADCQMQVFCADAAKPHHWPEDLNKLLRTEPNTAEKEITWVVALDSLYHFRPSRIPVFSFAFSQAKASIVASDLFLGEGLSLFQRFWFRFICSLMGAPSSNFVTVQAYRAQLVQAGYDDKDIHIHDVSEHVFVPLADNLGAQHSELKRYGLGGLGAYKYSANLFRWFGKSGVVRCCIVIAKR